MSGWTTREIIDGMRKMYGLRPLSTSVGPACDDGASENTTKEDSMGRKRDKTRAALAGEAMEREKKRAAERIDTAEEIEPGPPRVSLRKVVLEAANRLEEESLRLSGVDPAIFTPEDWARREADCNRKADEAALLRGELLRLTDPPVDVAVLKAEHGQMRDELLSATALLERKNKQFAVLSDHVKVLVSHLAGDDPAWWVAAADALRSADAMVNPGMQPGSQPGDPVPEIRIDGVTLNRLEIPDAG